MGLLDGMKNNDTAVDTNVPNDNTTTIPVETNMEQGDTMSILSWLQRVHGSIDEAIAKAEKLRSILS